MGKATAKFKGTASKVSAALSGKVGVLSTLEGEHTELNSLMDDVLAAKDMGKRRQLYHEIHQTLMVHTQGEEQGLYTQCRSYDATRSLADKAIQDHMQLKQLLAALDGLTLGSPEWSRKFDEFKSSFERHAEFEEHQLYPAAKDTLGNDALRDLDGRYKAHRKRVEERGEELDPRISRAG